MGRQQGKVPVEKQYRESDSSPYYEGDGSFIEYYSHNEQDFVGPSRRGRSIGRFRGPNRYGETDVHHDHYQDEPIFEDELGMRHPYERDDPFNRWSDDTRSESFHENHSGKGPKGYRRSRERIIEDASEILMRDYALDASEIEIEVQDDILVLKGQVNSRTDKKRAEALVENIPGISDVHNHLTISYQNVDGWIPGVGHIPPDSVSERGGKNE